MKTVIEQTLVIIKPDAVKRGLIGTVCQYLEEIGLKLMAAKMVKPKANVIKKHYPGTKNWLIEMGKKTLVSFQKSNLNVREIIGTNDPYKLGQFIYQRLIKYWQEGPIVVMVWQGPHAISIVRKLRGHTIPSLADPGTIHARFSYDSSVLSAQLDRVVKTFIHASGDRTEAKREIKYWFGKTEFKNYEREVNSLYLEK